MTDREALEKTLKVWEFLTLHPECDKEKAYDILKLSYDIYHCPLCERARRFNRYPECGCCLLQDLWPRGQCQQEGSIYLKWFYAAKPEDQILYAGRIAEATRTALARLQDDE